jgi:hypothetical protein
MKQLKAARQPSTFYTPLGSRIGPILRDLLGVGLDAPLGDDVPQQHSVRYPEDALFGVQFHPIGP